MTQPGYRTKSDTPRRCWAPGPQKNAKVSYILSFTLPEMQTSCNQDTIGNESAYTSDEEQARSSIETSKRMTQMADRGREERLGPRRQTQAGGNRDSERPFERATKRGITWCR